MGVIALVAVPSIVTPAAGNADPSADVLAQEARWLTAITAGDVATQKFVMNPSDELVDFAGDTAVVRGVNTVTKGDKVLARERFTDVFVLQNGTWMALSAQETAI